MKSERELIAAVLTLVGAQSNVPRAQVMADYEAYLRDVYDLQGRLGFELEHRLRERHDRPRTPPGPPGPPAPGRGGGG